MNSPAVRNIGYLVTPLKSQVLLLASQSSTSKCLFTPRKSSKNPDFPDICHKSGKFNDSAVPSFDTPNRKLISTHFKELQEFVLGRGSYGVVVRGRYKKKKVAVKIVQKRHENASRSLINEMNALELRHTNIVQMYHVENSDEISMGFVFMELFKHKNLENLLKEEIVPLKIKIKYLRDVACGLEYCHNNGVLHLDVKPKNIILNIDENRCKLCDFGSSLSKFDTRPETKEIVRGTLKYSAPELLKGQQATEKCDIYSFGITIWQMLNEKEPYEKEDLHVVVYKVVTQSYRPSNDDTGSSHLLEEVYTSCWDSNSSNRPSTSDLIKCFNKKLNKYVKVLL